ncbi:MAG TPA: hypothetical protein VF057_09515, partial [Thermoanaerobaculia bacterium]
LTMLAFVFLGGAAIVWNDRIRWSVVGPLVVAVAIGLAMFVYLRRLEHGWPYFELGAFYVAILLLYIAYPIVLYIVNGYRYPEYGDWRLIAVEHRPEVLGTMIWWYVLYLASFCAAYVVVRGRRVLREHFRVRPPEPGSATILAIVMLLVGARLFFVVLGFFYDMSAASYGDQYLVWRQLPHFVGQIAAQIQGIEITLEMMLAVALCCGSRKHRTILALLLLALVAWHMIRPGSRTELFVVFLAAVAAYHFAVARIPFRWMAATAVTGFGIMAFIGAVRQTTTFEFRDIGNKMAAATEFETILGNAVHLKYVAQVPGAFIDRPNLYWADLLAAVPQQFLPFPKETAALWYMRTYFREQYEAGGGLAFGLLAEGVMGHGWVEMIWRGLLVGALFALFHRLLTRPNVGVGYLMFYIWMIAWCYQTIRTGTFSLLMLMNYRFLVPLLAWKALAMLIRRGKRVAQVLGAPPRPRRLAA